MNEYQYLILLFSMSIVPAILTRNERHCRRFRNSRPMPLACSS